MFGKARKLAKSVQQLRACQKANGVGYKSQTATTEATALEKQVDDQVAEILAWPALAPDPADRD